MGWRNADVLRAPPSQCLSLELSVLPLREIEDPTDDGGVDLPVEAYPDEAESLGEWYISLLIGWSVMSRFSVGNAGAAGIRGRMPLFDSDVLVIVLDRDRATGSPARIGVRSCN